MPPCEIPRFDRTLTFAGEPRDGPEAMPVFDMLPRLELITGAARGGGSPLNRSWLSPRDDAARAHPSAMLPAFMEGWFEEHHEVHAHSDCSCKAHRGCIVAMHVRRQEIASNANSYL